MTADLREQLRRFGEWHETVQSEVDATDVVERVRPIGQPPRASRVDVKARPILVAGLAALLIVAIIGVPLLWSMGGDVDSPPAVGSTSTTVGRSDENAAPDTFDAAGEVPVAPWYRVADADGLWDGVALTDVVEFDGLLVAVGHSADAAGSAVVLTSQDGVTWSAASTPDSGAPRVLVEIGSQLVALGPGSTGIPTVWSSLDGRSWTSEPQERESAEFVDVADVVAGGPGLVAVGSAASPTGEDVAAVWTSEAGLRWTRVSHDRAVFGDSQFATRMNAVASGGGVLVAVGEGWGGGGVAWTSPDGLDWARAFVPDVGHDVEFLDGKFVSPLGWSSDGVEWEAFEWESDEFASLFETADLHPATVFEVIAGRLVAEQRPGMGLPWTMHVSEDGRVWKDVGVVTVGFDALTAGGPGMVAVGEVGIAVWFDDPSETAEYGDALVLDKPRIRETTELARQLSGPRRTTVERMLADYNEGRFDDWLRRFHEDPPELGNGLDVATEAALMVAGGRWQITGSCTPDVEIVLCLTRRSDAFYGAAGFDHEVFFLFRFNPGTAELIGYEVTGTGPNDWFDEHGVFATAFVEWLAQAHPETSVARVGGFGIDPTDMPVALRFVDEFVAQSDRYPID